MKIFKKLFYLLFLIALAVSYSPSFANCGDASQNADLDTQCNESQCHGTADDVKGCYLPPDAGANCPEESPNKTEDGICCCK